MKPELYRNTHTNKYRHIMLYLFDYNCSGKCLRLFGKQKKKNIKNKKKKNEKILKKFYHNTDRDHNKDSLKL